jgi:hypothetical protein
MIDAGSGFIIGEEDPADVDRMRAAPARARADARRRDRRGEPDSGGASTSSRSSAMIDDLPTSGRRRRRRDRERKPAAKTRCYSRRLYHCRVRGANELQRRRRNVQTIARQIKERLDEKTAEAKALYDEFAKARRSALVRQEPRRRARDVRRAEREERRYMKVADEVAELQTKLMRGARNGRRRRRRRRASPT